MLTVKRHVQPSGATNDAVFLHGNSHPLARILPYIYQDYVPDMETDIRRTDFCKEKTKKQTPSAARSTAMLAGVSMQARSGGQI